MKTIVLPADIEHLYLDEVAHLIADCLNPEGSSDPDGVRYALDKIQAENEVHQAAKDKLLRVRHPGTHGPFPMEVGLKRAVVLVPDVVAYLADRGIAVISEAPANEATTPATTETKEQRQDRRLRACIDAGLPMETKRASMRLPDGVGEIADREGVTRQAFSSDIKAALARLESAKREGSTVHRA